MNCVCICKYNYCESKNIKIKIGKELCETNTYQGEVQTRGQEIKTLSVMDIVDLVI